MVKEKKELVVVGNDYPMVLQDANDVLDAMKENFAGEEITSRDIFKVIPSPKAGDDYWAIETPDGQASYKELTGIILFIGNERAFYNGPYGEGSDIPLCSSIDAMQAIGDPGGSCAACPKKDWGADGELPECGQRKPMFILIPEINPILPVMIYITGTSFPALKKFRSGLAQYGMQPHQIQISLSLNVGKSKTGRAASVIQFKIDGNVKKNSPEIFKKIEVFRKTFMPYMNPNYGQTFGQSTDNAKPANKLGADKKE